MIRWSWNQVPTLQYYLNSTKNPTGPRLLLLLSAIVNKFLSGISEPIAIVTDRFNWKRNSSHVINPTSLINAVSSNWNESMRVKMRNMVITWFNYRPITGWFDFKSIDEAIDAINCCVRAVIWMMTQWNSFAATLTTPVARLIDELKYSMAASMWK